MQLDFKVDKMAWSKAVCLAPLMPGEYGLCERCDCTHGNVTDSELLSPGSPWGFSHHDMTEGFQVWPFKGLLNYQYHR